MGRPPLSRLRRRFVPLRGTQRRCAAPSAAARRFAPRLRGAMRPARCARDIFYNIEKSLFLLPPASARPFTVPGMLRDPRSELMVPHKQLETPI